MTQALLKAKGQRPPPATAPPLDRPSTAPALAPPGTGRHTGTGIERPTRLMSAIGGLRSSLRRGLGMNENVHNNNGRPSTARPLTGGGRPLSGGGGGGALLPGAGDPRRPLSSRPALTSAHSVPELRVGVMMANPNSSTSAAVPLCESFSDLSIRQFAAGHKTQGGHELR
eukprot:477886-Pyramimonas_sp.AAC.1